MDVPANHLPRPSRVPGRCRTPCPSFLKAARSLGVLKIGNAVAAIGACLDHPQGNLRKECAAALGEIADPAGLQFVERLTGDHDPDVRKNARWAVARITSAQAATQ